MFRFGIRLHRWFQSPLLLPASRLIFRQFPFVHYSADGAVGWRLFLKRVRARRAARPGVASCYGWHGWPGHVQIEARWAICSLTSESRSTLGRHRLPSSTGSCARIAAGCCASMTGPSARCVMPSWSSWRRRFSPCAVESTASRASRPCRPRRRACRSESRRAWGRAA
jgi:hypothetical protein